MRLYWGVINHLVEEVFDQGVVLESVLKCSICFYISFILLSMICETYVLYQTLLISQ